MPGIDLNTLFDLKRYFNPKTKAVTTLPRDNETEDGTMVIMEFTDGLYICVYNAGKWYKVSKLIEV